MSIAVDTMQTLADDHQTLKTIRVDANLLDTSNSSILWSLIQLVKGNDTKVEFVGLQGILEKLLTDGLTITIKLDKPVIPDQPVHPPDTPITQRIDPIHPEIKLGELKNNADFIPCALEERANNKSYQLIPGTNSTFYRIGGGTLFLNDKPLSIRTTMPIVKNLASMTEKARKTAIMLKYEGDEKKSTMLNSFIEHYVNSNGKMY
jgi:hypothetical protein